LWLQDTAVPPQELDPLAECIELSEDTTAFAGKLPARRGQHQAPADPIEQLEIELRLTPIARDSARKYGA
jgi:hypothetical protein